MHRSERRLALLITIVRQIGAKDEEEGEDDGDAQVTVEVERDVALRRVGVMDDDRRSAVGIVTIESARLQHDPPKTKKHKNAVQARDMLRGSTIFM